MIQNEYILQHSRANLEGIFCGGRLRVFAREKMSLRAKTCNPLIQLGYSRDRVGNLRKGNRRKGNSSRTDLHGGLPANRDSYRDRLLARQKGRESRPPLLDFTRDQFPWPILGSRRVLDARTRISLALGPQLNKRSRMERLGIKSPQSWG